MQPPDEDHALIVTGPQGALQAWPAAAARGLLALGMGRAEEAVAVLEEAAELTARQGVGHPAVILSQADLVAACIRVGRRAYAVAALDRLACEATTTDSAWGLAVAARYRGMMAEDDSFAAAFETALALHARSPSPFDRARTQLAYGERLRRRQRAAARHWLQAALNTFEQLGARPWTEWTRAELDRTGGGVRRRRDPSFEVLTPQERRVALTVAGGATNKDVARALFLNIYAKLGIQSRTQLAVLVMEQACKVSD